MERLLDVRYPPYEGKLGKMRGMNELKPNFDREGRVKFSWVRYILGLGSGSTIGGVARYAVLLLGMYIVSVYWSRDADLI